MIELAIKVDVDTHMGTRYGVPNLMALFKKLNVPATFLLSLGPDQTGRAIKRIFRPGFFKKVQRTNVLELYGLRTLLYGTLLPAPHIADSNASILRDLWKKGFEVGIHAYNHYVWQDSIHEMSNKEIEHQWNLAQGIFQKHFGTLATCGGAPGWQINEKAWGVIDRQNLLFSSDTRGESAFFPRMNGQVFKTLQLPTTLPTLDEWLGRPEFPESRLIDAYVFRLKPNALNVLTIHAEIEGMKKQLFFETLLESFLERGVQFVTMGALAQRALNQGNIPICDVIQKPIDGRSGNVCCQVL